jgi:hypothetical protein
MPFRLEIKGECVLPRETLRRNAEVNSRHPFIPERWASNGRKLAVVGGGPLVRNDLPELQAWDGDVWGINFTAQWLNANGVKATLFSVDPEPFVSAAPDAILGSVCDPSVFAAFEGRVQTFHMLQTHENGLSGGSCSASCAAAVALRMGYTNVSFFGCEGSFDGQDHVDRHENRPHQLIIRACGVDYVTCPPFLIQCEELAKLFVFDGVFHNRSGGLLKAMLEHPDTWEVVAVSAAFKEHLEEMNGKQGIYDKPYPLEAA